MIIRLHDSLAVFSDQETDLEFRYLGGTFALYFSTRMGGSEKIEVWIGAAEVVPRKGCELLSADEGAYVSFLTLAGGEEEYRAKVTGALNCYCLELIGLENIGPISLRIDLSEEVLAIATELEQQNNPKHVRYATFYTFPRLM